MSRFSNLEGSIYLPILATHAPAAKVIQCRGAKSACLVYICFTEVMINIANTI